MSLIHVHLNKKNRKNRKSRKAIITKQFYNFFVINLDCKKDYRTDTTINFLNLENFEFGIILNKNRNMQESTKRLYTIEPMYYMKTYTINQRIYMFIFYDFKYIINNKETYKKFIEWLTQIFHANVKHQRFFIISESDPLSFMYEYSDIVSEFFGIINPHRSKIVFILPNTPQPNSFSGVCKVGIPCVLTHESKESKLDNKPITYNYLLIGSVASTDDISMDANAETYAHITIGENLYVDIHTIPKVYFDRSVIMHFINKLQLFIDLYGEYKQLCNYVSKKKLKEICVNIVVEADQILAIEKYINSHRCIDSYINSLYAKYQRRKNLYSESLQRVFIQKLHEQIPNVKQMIYQFCVDS